MKKVRLRYAPSPTGRLHMGGARTALFNFLYAKHMNGDFLIRIEDTDIERNIEDGEKSQIDNLKWMGIEPDFFPGNEDEFGPYRQSERLEIYNEYINKLIENKNAYYCDCTQEELEKEKQIAKNNGIAYKYSGRCISRQNEVDKENSVIRIKMPNDKELKWLDGVRGEISVNSNDIGDWVIRKSNGIPTYSFANVIDDHLMKITHVLRGEEHISNTPKQLYLYELLKWNSPEYSHLTIITDMQGKKLSKRNEKLEQFIEGFRKKGYLPDALLNYLSLLGWSPKNEKEIFDKEELISIFTPNGLSKSSSKFDIEKLKWTNNQYIQKLNQDELWNFLIEYFDEKIYNEFSRETLMMIFNIYQPQLKYGEEILELIKLFRNDVLDKKISLNIEEMHLVNCLLEKFNEIQIWNSIEIMKVIKRLGDELNLKGRKLMFPIRKAITREISGPDISKVIEVFGKNKTLKILESYK